MKKILQYISPKALLLFCLAGLCILLAAGLSLLQGHLSRNLREQQMAERWSSGKDAVQISAFYAEDEVENTDYFRGVAAELDKELEAASLSTEKDNARLWIDAVSRNGKVTLMSESGKVELNAMGIQGSFFQFHPLLLVKGSYISEDHLMKDGIMIDEDTAWQLFGSSDVAGMQVMMEGVPHIIIGVFQREEGRLAHAAGLDKPICFLSMESLEVYGQPQGGYFYEIVLPNPIKGFGLSLMNKVLQAESSRVEVVENTTRYGIVPLIKVFREFGIRSMSSQGIIYPYWENIARGYEDIFTLLLLGKVLLMLYPVLLLITICVIMIRKNRGKTEQIFQWIGDKYYELGTKRMEKKQQKEGKENKYEKN